jgi:hypothetical protein
MALKTITVARTVATGLLTVAWWTAVATAMQPLMQPLTNWTLMENRCRLQGCSVFRGGLRGRETTTTSPSPKVSTGAARFAPNADS